MCLIKTLLRKTHWDINSVKEKEYTIIINVASLKTLPGKPSGTKPWLREKEYNMILNPHERTTFTFSNNNINLTPPSNNIPLSQLSISIFQSYSFQCYLSRSSCRIASSHILLKYIPLIYLHDIFYIHIFIQSHCQFLNLQQLNSSTKLWYVIAIKWTNI